VRSGRCTSIRLYTAWTVHTFSIDPLYRWKDVACVAIASEDEIRRTGYPVLVLIYSIGLVVWK